MVDMGGKCERSGEDTVERVSRWCRSFIRLYTNFIDHPYHEFLRRCTTSDDERVTNWALAGTEIIRVSFLKHDSIHRIIIFSLTRGLLARNSVRLCLPRKCNNFHLFFLPLYLFSSTKKKRKNKIREKEIIVRLWLFYWMD